MENSTTSTTLSQYLKDKDKFNAFKEMINKF